MWPRHSAGTPPLLRWDTTHRCEKRNSTVPPAACHHPARWHARWHGQTRKTPESTSNRAMGVTPRNSPMSRAFRQLPTLTGSRRLQAAFKKWAIQGPNTPPLLAEKPHVAGSGGSNSGNIPAPSGGSPDAPTPADPDLSAVVAAWPDLPPAIRAGVLALVKAGTPAPAANPTAGAAK